MDMVLMESGRWKNILHMISMNIMSLFRWDFLHCIILEEIIRPIRKSGSAIF